MYNGDKRTEKRKGSAVKRLILLTLTVLMLFSAVSCKGETLPPDGTEPVSESVTVPGTEPGTEPGETLPPSGTDEETAASTEPETEPETEPVPEEPKPENPIDIGIPAPTGKPAGRPLDEDGNVILLDAKVPGKPTDVFALPVKNGFLLLSCGSELPGEDVGQVFFWSLSEDGTLTRLGSAPLDGGYLFRESVFLTGTEVGYLDIGTMTYRVLSLRDFSEVFSFDASGTDSLFPSEDGSRIYFTKDSVLSFVDRDHRVTLLRDDPFLTYFEAGPELGNELRLRAEYTVDGNRYDYYIDRTTGEILFSEERDEYTVFTHGGDTSVRIEYGGRIPEIEIWKNGNHAFSSLLRAGSDGTLFALPEAGLLLEVVTNYEVGPFTRWDAYSLSDGALLFSVQSTDESLPYPYPSTACAGEAGPLLSFLSFFSPEDPETWDDGFRFVFLDRDARVGYDETPTPGWISVPQRPGQFAVLPDDLSEKRDALQETYGVSIYLGYEVTREYPDYGVEPVFEEDLMRDALDSLETALSRYPAGFFDRLCSGTVREIGFYLGGTLSGKNEGTLDYASAFAVICGGEQLFVFDIRQYYLIEQNVYHEIAHAIDRAIERDGTFDLSDLTWSGFNPRDAYYDYSYVDVSGDQTYCWYGDGRGDAAFIDWYARTYPTEDRARLMEYLMYDDPWFDAAACFSSPRIRAKLEYYFEGIRTVFGDLYTEPPYWEKRLETLTAEEAA